MSAHSDVFRRRLEVGSRRRIEAVSQRVAALQEDAGDNLWEELADALEWLRRLDALHQKGNAQSYFATRKASTEGRALAGLVYARNLLEYQGPDPHVWLATWAPIVSAATVEGGMVTLEWAFASENGFIPAVLHQPQREWRWKERAELPEPDRREKYCRDLDYDECVATKPLMGPLLAAENFLLQL